MGKRVPENRGGGAINATYFFTAYGDYGILFIISSAYSIRYESERITVKTNRTTKDGICRLEQENGKTLAWSESSGVGVLEQDGLFFKDLEKTGELLPYEDWRL